MARDSSLSADGNFGDGSHTPPSDLDPYSQGPNTGSSPFAQYPTKIELPRQSIISMLMGTSRAAYEDSATRIVCLGLDHIRFLAQRWPTQDETDVVLSCVASGDNFLAAGLGLGVAAAALVNRRSISKANMPTILLKRSQPQLYLTFAAVGMGVGHLTWVARESTRPMWDSRMATFTRDIARMPAEERRRREGRLQEYRKTRRRFRPRQAGSPYPDPSGAGSPGDEALSATDTFPPDHGQAYGGQQENFKILDEVYSRPGEGWKSQQQQSHGTQSSNNESNEAPDLLGDDSSASSSFPSSSPGPKPSGSAWDRIRQRQPKSPPQPQQQQQQQQQSRWQSIQQQSQQSQEPQAPQPDQSESTQSSSWSFSPSSYPAQEPARDTTASEKEKAQREFDELLERERNFGSGAGDAGGSGGSQDGGRGRRW